MMAAWWGRERTPEARARLEGGVPRLIGATRKDVRGTLEARIDAFTPEWTNQDDSDAGQALVSLFGEQMESVRERANRLPEKALVEYLRIAGIRPLPATPAGAILRFEIADGAPESVLVPKGFQVGGQPAAGDLLTFETERNLQAVPATIAELRVLEGRRGLEISQDAPFRPFGNKAQAGRALYVGLASEVSPGPELSLGILVAAPPGAPPPVGEGGIAPLPVPPSPLLRWEVLDGARVVPAELVLDQTGGLVRSGVVELRVPRGWRPSRRFGGDEDRYWLRLRIAHGSFRDPPQLRAILLNAVPAIAARTIRNEILEDVEEAIPGSRGRVMRLAQTPVLPGSLELEVEETINAPGLQTSPLETDGDRPGLWTEVTDLSASGPEDKTYVVDSATGEVRFGDGVHGALIPDGFRNVRALEYSIGGGEAGLDADGITVLVSSAPFVTGVSNPLPSSGGTAVEGIDAAKDRGPQEIRARGRAVTVADVALLARRAPKADVQRAHAVSGFHPTFPGVPIPGVIGVLIVPPDRGEGPPTPDVQTLRAVAEYLSSEAAPAGVEVVAAAPRYHMVRVEAKVVLALGSDTGTTVSDVLRFLDDYLHPLRGAEDGKGWKWGAALRFAPLQRLLVSKVDAVRAVPQLTLVVDGIRQPACTDFPTAPHALLWPDGHAVFPVEEEEA